MLVLINNFIKKISESFVFFALFIHLYMKAFIKSGNAAFIRVRIFLRILTDRKKGVIDVIADQNIRCGGESAILNIFSSCENYEEDIGTINKLIQSCSQSKESLKSLYVMFKKSVFAVGFSITSDYQLAEDCVSETFVRLTQIKHFDPKKGDGAGYIITIARNVALELRRRHRHDDESFLVQSYGVADHTVENSIYINELLMCLNDKQRQIVVLKCCSELTFKQIAKIMKCPESTVKSRYNRAIAILQEKAGVNSEK